MLITIGEKCINPETGRITEKSSVLKRWKTGQKLVSTCSIIYSKKDYIKRDYSHENPLPYSESPADQLEGDLHLARLRFFHPKLGL